MTWLNSEAFTLFGQHIMWSDMIGNVIGNYDNHVNIVSAQFGYSF